MCPSLDLNSLTYTLFPLDEACIKNNDMNRHLFYFAALHEILNTWHPPSFYILYLPFRRMKFAPKVESIVIVLFFFHRRPQTVSRTLILTGVNKHMHLSRVSFTSNTLFFFLLPPTPPTDNDGPERVVLCLGSSYSYSSSSSSTVNRR